MTTGERIRIGAPRPVVLTHAGAAVGWLALAVAAWRGQLSALPLVATALAALHALAGARLARTAVILTPTGVHDRRLTGQETVTPWSDLRLITVAPGAVELLTKGGERRRPPALRGGPGVSPRRFAERVALLRSAIPEGVDIPVGEPPSGGWNGRRRAGAGAAVLAGALVVMGAAVRADAPWEADWWPGGDVLASAPEPCALGEGTADALGLQRQPPPELPPGQDDAETTGCAYSGDRGRLSLVLTLHPWEGSAAESPADAASSAYYAAKPTTLESDEIDGATWQVSRDARGQEMWLLSSNVWAVVSYHDFTPDEEPELPAALDEELTALAERVVAALRD
ncbi:hypothetical protein [Streptomyces radicis]|uniref:Uncharacterized protein n=1 Tax=Streptomyces radicis TaxID=1750517 RepID=A0A3A9W9Q3_9ACTN|nr:hypothetical protein [Streptomyces radicis]RKN10021.1 hypothetical protein D7319_09555 [Streptomyces radicis]RKN24362.1 hypothetical protein D7318_10735 [Streptomyces radicis]